MSLPARAAGPVRDAVGDGPGGGGGRERANRAEPNPAPRRPPRGTPKQKAAARPPQPPQGGQEGGEPPGAGAGLPQHPVGDPTTRHTGHGVLPRHPPEAIRVTPTRMECTRCQTYVAHTSRGRQRWESECVYCAPGQNPQTMLSSQTKWRKEGRRNAMVVKQAKERDHGGPLMWTQHRATPLRCAKCEWRGAWDAKGNKAPRCPGTKERAQQKEARLREWVVRKTEQERSEWPSQGQREWEMAPYAAFCAKCFFYVLTSTGVHEQFSRDYRCGSTKKVRGLVWPAAWAAVEMAPRQRVGALAGEWMAELM